MSLTSVAPRPPVTAGADIAAPPWKPPLTADQLTRLVVRLRAFEPLVMGEVFDDLETVIGGFASTDPAELAGPGERLPRTLAYLRNIAATTPAAQLPSRTADMVERAGRLLAEAPPHAVSMGRLRRLALITEQLIGQMIENGIIKDDDV